MARGRNRWRESADYTLSVRLNPDIPIEREAISRLEALRQELRPIAPNQQVTHRQVVVALLLGYENMPQRDYYGENNHELLESIGAMLDERLKGMAVQSEMHEEAISVKRENESYLNNLSSLFS